MTTGLILGGLFGAAACLLIYALVPPRPALGGQVAGWQKQRMAQQAVAVEETTQGRDRLGRWLAGQLASRGVVLAKLRANAAIVDTTVEKHLVKKLAWGVAGAGFPLVIVTAIGAGAGVAIPFTIPAVAALAVGAAASFVPDLELASQAERRRRDLRRALACYLDLVSMSLAGGRGIPEALPTAARIGQGWAFELLQSVLDRAKLVDETPWVAFSELGRRFKMRELQDMGGALQLVAHDGAKIRASLAARAETQRHRHLAEAEDQISDANQSVMFAAIVMGLGFFLFLLYPAVTAVMAL